MLVYYSVLRIHWHHALIYLHFTGFPISTTPTLVSRENCTSRFAAINDENTYSRLSHNRSMFTYGVPSSELLVSYVISWNVSTHFSVDLNPKTYLISPNMLLYNACCARSLNASMNPKAYIHSTVNSAKPLRLMLRCWILAAKNNKEK